MVRAIRSGEALSAHMHANPLNQIDVMEVLPADYPVRITFTAASPSLKLVARHSNRSGGTVILAPAGR